MKYWLEYEGHKTNILGKRNKFDNTIYTFDIETTSYLILNNKQLTPAEYLTLTEEQKKECIFQSTMYIWMFGINDVVYYGRTWEDLRLFLNRLEYYGTEEKKYIYVHNLSYEFQFLRNEFEFENVFARKSRHVIRASLLDYNIEFRCSYYLSNVNLDKLSKVYQLPINKLVGNLNYNTQRSYKTKLTDKELAYCENDCLVVYEYIKFLLQKYYTLKNIPMTSTGFVRKELKEKLRKDYNYRNQVRKSINIDGHIYNMLVDRICWTGTYTLTGYILVK